MSVFQDRASGEGCLAEFAIPNQIRDRASGEGCLAEFAIPNQIRDRVMLFQCIYSEISILEFCFVRK
jgi:hypothetical protein